MKKVDFEVVNNHHIFYVADELESKKIVIMSHGFRGSSIGPARTFVDFAALLHQNGISTLRYDQYGSGNSEGTFLDSSFVDWQATLSHFTQKYLDLDYEVILLGQSMGATATMAVAAQEQFIEHIPALVLWVPDPKIDIVIDAKAEYEEAGQKYRGLFWHEANDSNFFECLEKYPGNIHLVYGEEDMYIAPEVKAQVMEKAQAKGHQVMVLPGQDHSSWEHAAAQKVFETELEFVLLHFS